MISAMENMSILFVLLFSIPHTFSLTSIQRSSRVFGGRQFLHVSSDRVWSALKAVSNEDVAEQEEKFKIITCMSTACSRKRQSLGMDNLCTFGAMYARASDSRVQVEEGPCIGSCKKAPCVSIEHEDFFGSVALEGMTADEFASDAFLNVVTEEDADRVWSCVANAVQVMAEAEEDDEE